MTAHKYVTLWCDGGTALRPCHARFEAPMQHTNTGARREARKRGWRYVPGHPTTGSGDDLCPEHARST